MSLALVTALGLSLNSCRETKEKTENVVEKAADSESDAVNYTKEVASDAVEDITDAANDVLDSTKDSIKDGAEDMANGAKDAKNDVVYKAKGNIGN